MKTLALQENWFQGVIAFRREKGWWQPLRVRFEDLPFHPEGLTRMAEMPSGCRLRFATDSDTVELLLEPDPDQAVRTFDLTQEGTLLQTVKVPPDGQRARFDGLRKGRKVLELWLPVCPTVRLRGMAVCDGAALEACDDPRPRWVTYGSSITHCGEAHSPARAWPAVAARLRGLSVTALGYGGQCHMDPLMALTIRDIPADFISLKVGINMVGGSVSQRTFRPMLVGMVKIIREKQPTTPVTVVSPIISPPRETTPGATGMTLQLMRQELEDAVKCMRDDGDANVRYVSGLDLFGEDLVAHYLPDLLHPNGDGYEILGRNFVRHAIDPLGLSQGRLD